MNNRFVQIHTLTSYPAALLNRDDTGMAKRMPFGGSVRGRISSQCLKRHWRLNLGPHSLGMLNVPGAIRSRQTFEEYIVKPLIEEDGLAPEIVRAVTESLMAKVLGKHEEKFDPEEAASTKSPGAAKKTKTSRKNDKEADGEPRSEKIEPLHTEQVTVLGRPEVDFLRSEARTICAAVSEPSQATDAVSKHLSKERLDNLKNLKNACGLDAALFGRMVTSDLLARSDAAIHVAHSLTVHGEAVELDYFSAVDELKATAEDSQLGSGHIGTTELMSGLFYGYVVVDLPVLVSNLEGCSPKDWARADRHLASRVVSSLVYLIATVTPGAKLGSTAPYSAALFVLAEAGNAQPRTLANAFLDRVPERPSLLDNTLSALGAHLKDFDAMYGKAGERAIASLRHSSDLCAALGVEKGVPLSELAQWAANQVLSS